MAVSLPLRSLTLPRVLQAASGMRLKVLVVGATVGLALAVRWPNLLLSPRFPSVGPTVELALAVADGRRLPLADQAPYLGAIFVYLLAAVYKLFGPSVEATMLLPWALGGLAVVPTYLLGRELGGRIAGTAAGALMATSGAHVVISSHVALSHSLTPLFAATTLWLVARAISRGDGRWLAPAGLAAGLTLQTHPTAAPLLGGAAVAALLLHRVWVRSRWPYLAAVCVLLGYGTLLAHHVQTRFEIVPDVQSKQARYLDADADADEHPEHGVYVNNLQQLAVSLIRLTSGALDDRDVSAEYATDPRVIAYPLLGLVGIILGGRSARLLLGIALLPAILLPPLLSGKYEPILDGRYLMPLVPVVYVGIGLAFAAAARAAPAGAARAAAGPSIGLLGALLALAPLGPLAEFYEQSLEDGFSNSGYYRTIEQLERARRPGESVVLDARLDTVKSAGGGKAGWSLGFLLALERLPAERRAVGADEGALAGRLAVLHRDTAKELRDTLTLQPLDIRRPSDDDEPSYRVYRLSAR